MDGMTLPGVLILQLLFTAYYIYFLIRPLTQIEKISGKSNYGYRLLIFRTICVILIDMFDYKLSMFLDLGLLLGLSFIVSPQIKKDLLYVQSVDTKLANYNELTDEELSSFGIKSRKLLEETLFNKLKLIQTARSTYDYDTVKRLCTKKLANLFTSELVMINEADLDYHYEDYKPLEIQIYEIKSTETEITIKAAIKASCVFYRLDAEGKIIDGSKNHRTIIAHEVAYVKNIETKDIEQNCPNCGAPTKTTAKGKCSYCNTIIKQEFAGWKLSEYKIIAEKLVDKL